MADTFVNDREIAAQPMILDAWAKIRDWITARAPDEIWLCGAGTLAFSGDSFCVALDRLCSRIPLRHVAITDLLARPQGFFRANPRPLVISFGRSGNSSESIGTLGLLGRIAANASRLHITCNSTSALATRAAKGTGEQRVIALPDACHNAGFAMTPSYSTMTWAAQRSKRGSLRVIWWRCHRAAGPPRAAPTANFLQRPRKR